MSSTSRRVDNGTGLGVGDAYQLPEPSVDRRGEDVQRSDRERASSCRRVMCRGCVARDRRSLQVNLPFSKQTGDWYWHWNAGFTWLPSAELGATNPAEDNGVDLMSPFLSRRVESIACGRCSTSCSTRAAVRRADRGGRCSRRHRRGDGVRTLPGARGGWNLGDQQLDPGAAVPITWVGGEVETGLLLYLSSNCHSETVGCQGARGKVPGAGASAGG